MLSVSRTQAVNYRLVVNSLSSRLAAGAYVEAAYVGLQDTAPREALLGLHARVQACEPSAWQDSRLIQTYSPRQAVYVLPAADFGIFTVGRLPRDPEARQALEDLAEEACREARKTFDLIADELVPIDLAGRDAWVLAADESALRSAPPMCGVRLLVASDLRLFGQDRTQLFVGPGKNDHSPLQDWHHPNGLVVHVRIVGAWGRRGGRVTIKAIGPLAPSIRRAVHAEAASMPIPNTAIAVSLTER